MNESVDNKFLQHVPYYATLIMEHSTIELSERSASFEECVLDVVIDQQPVGAIRLPYYHPPQFGVSNLHILIWANTDLYLINRAAYALSAFHQDEPVKAAYPLSGHWCLVRELSVVVIDRDRGDIEAQYDYDEVLMASWWIGTRLIVEDFEGRRLVFQESVDAPYLSPVETTA